MRQAKPHGVILTCLAVTGLGVLLAACASAEEKPLEHNVCRGVRDVRIHPALADAGWVEPITWAFERWKGVVPGISYQIRISDEASETTLPCVTSFVPFDFRPPEYASPVFGDTRNGFIRIAPDKLAEGGRRALILHELGHLLFGFGHVNDITSIMFRVIQAEPQLSDKDIAEARAAFLRRDGGS